MGVLSATVIDFGLDVLSNEATHIVVCTSEPTAYSACSIGSSNLIGYRSFGVAAAILPGSHTSQAAAATGLDWPRLSPSLFRRSMTMALRS